MSGREKPWLTRISGRGEKPRRRWAVWMGSSDEIRRWVRLTGPHHRQDHIFTGLAGLTRRRGGPIAPKDQSALAQHDILEQYIRSPISGANNYGVWKSGAYTPTKESGDLTHAFYDEASQIYSIMFYKTAFDRPTDRFHPSIISADPGIDTVFEKRLASDHLAVLDIMATRGLVTSKLHGSTEYWNAMKDYMRDRVHRGRLRTSTDKIREVELTLAIWNRQVSGMIHAPADFLIGTRRGPKSRGTRFRVRDIKALPGYYPVCKRCGIRLTEESQYRWMREARHSWSVCKNCYNETRRIKRQAKLSDTRRKPVRHSKSKPAKK